MRKVGVLLVVAAGGCSPDPALMRFRQTLASHDSATLALQQWCAARAIASPARIEALAMDDGAAMPAGPAIRAALNVAPDEPVMARHVRLICGTTVLSDARNWYVPARLTPAMNRVLTTTRTPFGIVVAPLGLHRVALRAGVPPCPAGTILHVTAVLHRHDGLAYSLVSECYTRANIARRQAL